MTVLPKSRAGPLDRYSYESVAARIAQRTQESLFRFSYGAVNKKRREWRQIGEFFYNLQKNHNLKSHNEVFISGLAMEFLHRELLFAHLLYNFSCSFSIAELLADAPGQQSHYNNARDDPAARHPASDV